MEVILLEDVKSLGKKGVQRTAQCYSICYKKQRRVVELEIRVEIET